MIASEYCECWYNSVTCQCVENSLCWCRHQLHFVKKRLFVFWAVFDCCTRHIVVSSFILVWALVKRRTPSRAGENILDDIGRRGYRELPQRKAGSISFRDPIGVRLKNKNKHNTTLHIIYVENWNINNSGTSILGGILCSKSLFLFRSYFPSAHVSNLVWTSIVFSYIVLLRWPVAPDIVYRIISFSWMAEVPFHTKVWHYYFCRSSTNCE